MAEDKPDENKCKKFSEFFMPSEIADFHYTRMMQHIATRGRFLLKAWTVSTVTLPVLRKRQQKVNKEPVIERLGLKRGLGMHSYKEAFTGIVLIPHRMNSKCMSQIDGCT